jgi:hypothetical protein
MKMTTITVFICQPLRGWAAAALAAASIDIALSCGANWPAGFRVGVIAAGFFLPG